MTLDAPEHPLAALISHYTASIQTSAPSVTERHSTTIELLRRQLATAPEPSPSVRRLTYLQGIAKTRESGSSGKSEDERSRRGWDTDAVEDMWNAVLTFVKEMGVLSNELAGLKDLVDRAMDKVAVFSPSPRAKTLNNTVFSLLTFLTMWDS